MIAATTVTLDTESLLVWAVVGLVAGFFASRVMLGHGMGVLGDIVVGIIGAILGGFLARAMGITVSIPGHTIITEIVVAFAGAVILLAILRIIGVGGRRHTWVP